MRRVAAVGQAKRGQSSGIRHTDQGQIILYRQGSRIWTRHRQLPALCTGCAKAVIMRQALGLPAQKVVQHTGVGADVVAGNHAGIQKPGQGVHQLQPHTIMALCGNPDRNPDVRRFALVGQNVPGGAQNFAVLLRQRKLWGGTGRVGIIELVKIGPVDQRQAHVKILVDKVRNAGILAGAG